LSVRSTAAAAALAVGLGLIASACTSLRPAAPGAALGPAEQVRWLQQLERFQLHGRLAGAVGTEGFNAQLDLQQRGTASRLVMRSPLGFGSATVDTDGRSLQFSSSRGERLEGDAGLRALSTRLGFEPPLGSLRYWVLGVPDPASAAVEEPAPPAGAARVFAQAGWRVTITEMASTQGSAGPVAVPRRLTLERAPARLRVVIDKWNLGG
jgi:outer membrane lipoprotein LolB